MAGPCQPRGAGTQQCSLSGKDAHGFLLGSTFLALSLHCLHFQHQHLQKTLQLMGDLSGLQGGSQSQEGLALAALPTLREVGGGKRIFAPCTLPHSFLCF